jgi:hypothetical protein
VNAQSWLHAGSSHFINPDDIVMTARFHMNSLVLIHVISGLIGIVCGLVVVAGMFSQKNMSGWTGIFLTTTLTACITGFCFLPVDGFTTAQLVGVFTTILLGLAIYARYVQQLAGNWNQMYIITIVAALYLNVLIATAQSFQHLRFLRRLAPTQSSPAYIIIKTISLMLFIVIGFFAVKRSADQRV